MLPPFYGQSYEPGLWSGSVWDDLADHTAWVTEHAVWEAMMVRQDQPGVDDPPGRNLRRGHGHPPGPAAPMIC